MSRNANVLSLSNSFIEGMSPAALVRTMGSMLDKVDIPLMILQKMQLAAILNQIRQGIPLMFIQFKPIRLQLYTPHFLAGLWKLAQTTTL